MKSERRHELEQNELADWLAHKIEAVKPYQNAILGGLLLLVVVLLAYGVYARSTQTKEADGWNAFYAALAQTRSSPADFDVVAKQHSGTTAAQWANVMAADMYLGTGCDMLFRDKTTARVDLTEAQKRYEEVLASSNISMLRERATYGLARAVESQGVDLKEAIRRYEEVSTKWPNGAFAETSAQRAKDLSRQSTKWMYDQFAKYEPAAEFEDEPGIPGSRLDLDAPGALSDDPIFEKSPFDAMRDEGESTAPPLNVDDLTEPAVPGPVVPETTDDTTAAPEAPGPATEQPEATEPEPATDGSTEPAAEQPEPAATEGTTEAEETTDQDE